MICLLVSLESLRRIESAHQQAIARQQKDLDLLQRQVRDSRITSQDWAHWDDSLAFVEGRNPKFPSRDMGTTALISHGAVMTITGENGQRLAIAGATAEDRRDGSLLNHCLEDVEQRRRKLAVTHLAVICPGENQFYVGNLETISDNDAVRRTNASLAYLVPMQEHTDHSPIAQAMNQLEDELMLQPGNTSTGSSNLVEPLLWTTGEVPVRVRPPEEETRVVQELLALALLVGSLSLLLLGLRMQWSLGQRRLQLERRQQQRATSQRIRHSERELAAVIEQHQTSGGGDEGDAFARLLEQGPLAPPVGDTNQHNQDRLVDRLEHLLRRSRTLVLQDRLTGLPNRSFFLERLAWQRSQSQARGERLALLFVNIDQFKQINDTYGHNTGDEVLIQLAADLRNTVGERAFLARFGGDEFALILNTNGTTSNEEISTQAHQLAVDVVQSIQQRAAIRNAPVRLSLSIGIGLGDAESTSAEELVRRSDRAMSQAKSRQTGNISSFDLNSELDSTQDYRLYNALQSDLTQEPDRFSVLFQPIVDATNTLKTVEALARWHNPIYRNVSPDQFFAVAERYRMILELGPFILNQTFSAFNQLRQGLQRQDLGLAVNISPSQLKQPEFAQQLLEQLQNHQIPAKQLTLEVTESAVFERGEALSANLAILRQAGMRLALDDFGTGFSSLRLLVWLRPDELKIDKSFVLAAATDPFAYQIVLLLQQLAERMQLTLVAEGVEDHAVLDLLQHAGLSRFQGFLFARAQLPNDLVRTTAPQPPAPAA